MTLVEPLGGLVDDAVGHDVSSIARGADQIHCAGIAAGKGHFVFAGSLHLAAVRCLHSVPDISAALTQLHGAFHGVHHLLCSHFGTVVEGHVVSELEGPDRTVLVLRPFGGQQGVHFAGLGIVAGQSLINILQSHKAVGILRAGVQGDIGCRVVSMVQNLRAAGAGAVTGTGFALVSAAGGKGEQHTQRQNQSSQTLHSFHLQISHDNMLSGQPKHGNIIRFHLIHCKNSLYNFSHFVKTCKIKFIFIVF